MNSPKSYCPFDRNHPRASVMRTTKQRENYKQVIQATDFLAEEKSCVEEAYSPVWSNGQRGR